MRLIHTKELYIREFMEDPEKIQYATLSHRWGRSELSFQTFHRALRASTRSEGATKIIRCCELAHKRGIQWLWVDTACIDKTDSSELSEAINSMWRWYELATECYVYLADVGRISHQEVRPSWQTWSSGTLSRESFIQLRSSDWFTRGWTLQELLAPRRVIFYDMNWREFGTKSDLSWELSWITGVRGRYLRGRESVRSTSIAARMSWASKRQTTKKEDSAYCLLGLFDVNMPMLYGEGDKAFMRLQLELLKKSPDESIFAWRRTGAGYTGLLATSPADFSDSGHIVHFTRPHHQRLPYSMTNQGLELRLPFHLDSVRGPSTIKKSSKRYLRNTNPIRPRFSGSTTSINQHHRYRDIGYQMPTAPLNRTKKVYLNCGSSEYARTGSTNEEILACAMKHPVCLTLGVVESVWQRIHCEKLATPRDNSNWDFAPLRTTYSLYYIPQQGL